jgi:hypothetical protein
MQTLLVLWGLSDMHGVTEVLRFWRRLFQNNTLTILSLLILSMALFISNRTHYRSYGNICVHYLQIEKRSLYDKLWDCLCGLVATISGYRHRGPGFDSRPYQIFLRSSWFGSESSRPREDKWGTLEEIIAAPVKGTETNGRGDPSRQHFMCKSWHQIHRTASVPQSV